MRYHHPFDRSGLVPLSDYQTAEWMESFAFLEMQQLEFHSNEGSFRSPTYKWPRDPLHTWSRAWEYPYVFHHLRDWRQKLNGVKLPRAVDVGSGVTFFPFALAKLGFHVTCTDIDPVCETDITRAASVMPHEPGVVDCRCNNRSRISCEDNEADAVYCISVLEHVDSIEETVSEMARILKPSGLLVLTVDIDLRGDSAIGVKDYMRLRDALMTRFVWRQPETTIHPAEMLRSDTGPFKIQNLRGLRLLRFNIWQRARQMLLGLKPIPAIPFELAVAGFVMTKR